MPSKYFRDGSTKNTSGVRKGGQRDYIDFFDSPWNTLYHTYHCPYCTWFRTRLDKEWWEKIIIEHPLYGRISNIDLYYHDIYTHDCQLTAAARERIGVDRHVRYDANGRRVAEGPRRLSYRRQND